MEAQPNTKSKPLSQEGRKRLYRVLGNNLLGYKIQADYLQAQLQHTEEANSEIMYRMTIIGMDLCASVRACLISENLYERRYHIKYLWVDLYEAYNAFYGDGNDDNSYFAKWEKANPHIKEDGGYDSVVKKLNDLRETLNIKIHDERNSYVHYDEDPIKTTQYLLSINSEDEPTQRVCDLLEVFELVKNICERQHKLKIEESLSAFSAMSIIMRGLRSKLRSDMDLVQSVNEVIEGAENKLKDAMLSYNFFTIMPFENYGEIKHLIQAHLLIQIVRADLAAAVRAFLYAESEIESMLHIRRAIIIRQAGAEHLKNIFEKLSTVSVRGADKNMIESIGVASPRNTRNKLVHYRYGKKDYIKKFYSYCSDEIKMMTSLTEIVYLLNDLNTLEWSLTQILRDAHEMENESNLK